MNIEVMPEVSCVPLARCTTGGSNCGPRAQATHHVEEHDEPALGMGAVAGLRGRC